MSNVKLQEFIKNIIPIIRSKLMLLIGVSFSVGILVGWLVIGWWLYPVEWKDADPSSLHPDFRNQWVQMVADSFVLTTDIEAASNRVAWLGKYPFELIEVARISADGAEKLRIAQLSATLGSIGYVDGDLYSTSDVLELSNDVQQQNDSGRNRSVLISVLGGLFIIVCMAGVGIFILKNVKKNSRLENVITHRDSDSSSLEIGESIENSSDFDATISASTQTDDKPPLSRFMTTFLLGDDLYDDSFGIDDANGDFLGECGMGISDLIGVGEPKKVCAFEIWLFDKNDVRTVTKVLMSEDAFSDDSKRASLAPKGEPIKADSGKTISLETACLLVTARVVDMQYGRGALPQNSFFNQITVEIAAWKKEQ